jgi:hypothetical protein
MNRRATVVALAVAAGGSVALPAAAESLGVGWEGSFTDARLVDGYEATGAQLVVPVTFEYQGSPGSVITDLTLELQPISSECDALSYTQALQSGDGSGTPGPTSPTQPQPEPDPSAASATATWTFRVDPRCNGVYDLQVVGRADPAGTLQPGDPGTESEPLQLSAVEVSLAAPSPTGVSATVRADRKVEVRWAPPSEWAGGAPPDAFGYRVVRAAGTGAPVTVADDLTLSTLSIVDDSAATAPPGRYRYAVIAMRKDASGDFVLSPPADTSLDIAPPPTAVPAASTTARPTNLGSGARVGSRPRVAAPAPPAPVIDDTFDPELDYSGLETGPEQAIVPDDANLFEVVTEDTVGAGLLVPGAIALCLAVWAGHLRHLARRAAPVAR